MAMSQLTNGSAQYLKHNTTRCREVVMLNPINWILLVVEIVDFMDEEMAGWVRMR
jgi:hypothetical protein